MSLDHAMPDTITEPHQVAVEPVPQALAPPQSGDLTDALMAREFWDEHMLEEAGIPIKEVDFVSVGGGIGTFVTMDYLRIYGVPAEKLRVLTQQDYPWQTYEFLAQVSQISAEDRIRSDSSSRPDCIWGFPSFALSEAIRARTWRGFIAPLFQVLVEPILTDYYTPKAGHVFQMLQRESDRISYDSLVDRGSVQLVRRRSGGGYFTILTPPAGSSATRHVAYRSRFVHLAVGYPGLKFLPTLQAYRQEHCDFTHVVNAYEPHERVYEELKRKGGTVILRGGGIVASRVLQRLVDDRDRAGAQTTIYHLFRTYVGGSHGPSLFMRRRGGDGWAYQGFNVPKSAWGGQLKSRMRKLEGQDREALYQTIGGTTTARRKQWRQQITRGKREGWYTTVVGEIDSVTPAGSDAIVTGIRTPDGLVELTAGYIIDATGMEVGLEEHEVLADLLEHGGAGRNPLGRLDVERTFEVRGTRNEDGRLYASGAATMGGYFPGVDTFLGLQISAQEIADDLVRQGFGRRLGPIRSTRQWLRWARNKRI